MRASKRANVGLAVLVALIVALAFFGYRFSHYGQVSAPGPGEPAKVDQKPPETYKPRPQ
jgi:hypothetical protein